MVLPSTAEVVIIGGGVMGASTAYHLALRGCKDVVLLERETFFGQGATGRCAGGIRYQFSTEINVRLSQLSLPMLERFQEELDQPIDLRWVGYLMLASSDENRAEFQRNIALQNRLGVDSEWLPARDAAAMVPLINSDGILGEMAGLEIPVLPVRRQIVATAPLPQVHTEPPARV